MSRPARQNAVVDARVREFSLSRNLSNRYPDTFISRVMHVFDVVYIDDSLMMLIDHHLAETRLVIAETFSMIEHTCEHHVSTGRH